MWICGQLKNNRVPHIPTIPTMITLTFWWSSFLLLCLSYALSFLRFVVLTRYCWRSLFARESKAKIGYFSRSKVPILSKTDLFWIAFRLRQQYLVKILLAKYFFPNRGAKIGISGVCIALVLSRIVVFWITCWLRQQYLVKTTNLKKESAFDRHNKRNDDHPKVTVIVVGMVGMWGTRPFLSCPHIHHSQPPT